MRIRPTAVTGLAALILLLSGTNPATAAPPIVSPPRIISLDECADQYVLGLVPRDRIAAVSDKAALPDSFYRDRVRGLRQVRPSAESVLALKPDIVVRTWGGDPRLIRMLGQNGIRVVSINDIKTFDEARSELHRVGDAMEADAEAQGEAERFQAALNDIRPIGLDRTILYYTPGGYSAGPDTMIGEMLRKLAFRLESQDKGFFPLSPEVILSLHPDVFALGFFDDVYEMRRAPGRNPVVRDLIAATPHFTLPRRAMLCGGWYSAYDLRVLSHSIEVK